MILLGIDPGPELHGYALLDTETWRVLASGNSPTPLIYARGAPILDGIAIENVQPMGQVLSHGLLATIRAQIELEREAQELMYRAPILVPRVAVKRELVGKHNCNEPHVNAALRARYCERHKCSESALKGTKKNPGPLFGISSHAWPALALLEVVIANFLPALQRNTV